MNTTPTTPKPPRVTERWGLNIAWFIGSAQGLFVGGLVDVPPWQRGLIGAASLIAMLLIARYVLRRPIDR